MKTVLIGIMAIAGLAFAQDVSKFKVFGFADLSTDTYIYDHSFNKSVIGQDSNTIKLGHANLYFDFKPNGKVQGLVEIGLAQQENINRYNGISPFGNATVQSQIVDEDGDAMTDDQIIDILTEYQIQTLLEQQQIPAAQQEAAAAAMRPQVRAGVAAGVSPYLAQFRNALGTNQSASETRETQRVSLVRAQFDLLLSDAINIRMGKFITPAGIWNVDHASPVILTIRQPIQTSITPLFPESQTGIMLFGRQYLGDHDLTYNAYVTTGRSGPGNAMIGSNYDNSIDNLGDLAVGGHVGVKLDILKGISIGTSAMTGTMRKKYQETRAVFEFDELLPLLTQQSATVPEPDIVMGDKLAIQDRELIVGGDFKVEVANVLLQGEVNYRSIKNELVKDAGTNMMGFYGLLGYKLPLGENFALTPYAMYEQVTWEVEDKGRAGTLGAEDIDGFSMALCGLNLSLYTNLRIKMEYAQLQLQRPKDSTLPKAIGEKELLTQIISTQFSVAF